MLDSVKKTYADSLTEDERQIYFALKEDQQTVFRICRDLAHLPEPKREPLTFYLSFNQLGLRIGVYDMQAQRIMRQLQHFGLVGLIEKGTRRALGVRGKAGTYKWLLSYPNGGNQNHE